MASKLSRWGHRLMRPWGGVIQRTDASAKNSFAGTRFSSFLCLVCLLVCLLATNSWAQRFGKNKITDQQFDWMIHRTEHFDIHYYPSEERLVPIMADIAEEAYERHSEDFEHEIRDRTPLILYQSHKDFQETNIILQELHEGIGGFADRFKRRVVIPFTGSMEAFREVIVHELVHIFQYDIIYQKPAGQIYSGEFLYSPPIWFIEGMADYFGEDNNAIGEMVLRDASIANQIVPLMHLDRVWAVQPFMGYKLGQSAIGYLAETYGRDKVGQIMHELRHIRTKDLSEAFKNVVDISLEQFDKEWRQMVQKKYWPKIEYKGMPDLIAKNLTEKSRYSHNIKPVWSPSGDIIAYVTGNDGFSEIVLMSARDGSRVDRISKRFFRSKYEEIRADLSGTDNGLDWSPDGDRIAFITKYRGSDYLLDVNIITKKLAHRIKLDFEAAHSPSYDGSGERIIFSALKNGQTDLYIISLATEDITRLTNDTFDDIHPSWHPTKEEVIYASEREGRYKLITIDVNRRTQRQLTYGEHNAISPNWSAEGDELIFCSDLNGVYDLYTMKPDGKDFTRLTDVMTACFNPRFSPDRKHILFGAYQGGKQDIYVMETEKAINEKIDMPPLDFQPVVAEAPIQRLPRRIARRKYGTKIGLDAIFTSFNLGSDGLLRNTTDLIASDMMGNHRLGLSVVNQSGFLAPDFIAQYSYLSRRADLGVAFFNYHEYHLLGTPFNRRGVLQRVTGLIGSVNYPFNRYRRLELELRMYSTPFAFRYQTDRPDDRGFLMLAKASLVSDTTMWREFGPHRGTRYNLTVEQSLPRLGSDLALTNVILDARRYFKLSRRSTFATRLLLGGSFGADESIFYLGGIDTLRGYSYEELIGTRMGLLKFEIRIPFIDELRFGWPFAWAIGGIRGIIFADFGTVWSKKEFSGDNDYHVFRKEGNRIRLDDVKGSVGVGLRLQLGLFSLDFDVARRTDLATLDPDVMFHFGLGQAF
ncbi:MAG: BamA/TamA family outer membrane protein [Candidatus Poribacteria bacterium]|nr:BamA/TamA family outer membrane protein [Candidatus Poribacteria bacterium]